MMITETIMDHLSRTVGKTPAALRELNLYKEGETTHFGQVLEGCQVCPPPHSMQLLAPAADPCMGLLSKTMAAPLFPGMPLDVG
jgi:hypothetical protein